MNTQGTICIDMQHASISGLQAIHFWSRIYSPSVHFPLVKHALHLNAGGQILVNP